jgi:hypothetical protein
MVDQHSVGAFLADASEFALDVAVAPGRVFLREAEHQVTGLLTGGRADHGGLSHGTGDRLIHPNHAHIRSDGSTYRTR